MLGHTGLVPITAPPPVCIPDVIGASPPSVCVPAVLGAIAVLIQNQKKKQGALAVWEKEKAR